MRFVLGSDDFFGVFEWGQGGIVHIHLLRWLARRGRYDFVDGSVPEERRRRDAQTLAMDHEMELAEWALCAPRNSDGMSGTRSGL